MRQASLIFFGLISFSAFSQLRTFEYTGDVQTYQVPPGITSLEVEMYGASGGWNDYSGVRYDKYEPGKGGKLTATIPVQTGQILYIYVGGEGESGSSGQGGSGGFNGGGSGTSSSIYSGGGGGGASDIRLNGTGLSDRILVAGGGGGAAYNYPDGGDDGGHGGDQIGGDGFSNNAQSDDSRGRGGSQTEGGTGGQWSGYERAQDGTLGQGGNGAQGSCGTGGGGGYYGGGGGCWSGGGGGSSYAWKKAQQVNHAQGVNSGNGRVILKTGNHFYTTQPSCTNPLVRISGDTQLCEGESITLYAQSSFGAILRWDNGVQNGVSFTPPVGTKTYTLTSSDVRECSYAVEITVHPRSIKATTTNGIICAGETTTLIGYGGTNYSWDQGVQNNVPFVPPVGVNSYTVRSYDLNGTNRCSSEASVFVVVNQVHVLSNVTAASSTQGAAIDLLPTGGTYPYSYIWYKDGTEYARTEDLYHVSAGSYEVMVVDAIGCSASHSVVVGTNQTRTSSQGLQANLSGDQRYLEVTYGGIFNYKITNYRNEVLISGTVSYEGQIDLSGLPSGLYRISSQDANSSEGVNFTKW